MSDLNLETGDTKEAARILSEGQATSGSRAKVGGSARPTKAAAKAAAEAEEKSLKQQCLDTFADFVEQFEERDPELADVLKRRKEAMSQGLVGLTRNVRILRTPLTWALGFLQPTMAFWELGGLLLGRFAERRNRTQLERRNESNGQVDVTDVAGNSAAGYA